MTAARARSRLARWDFDVLPRVRGEIVHCSLVCSAALLESSEDDHVRRFVVNNAGVLVTKQNLVTTSSDGLPCHRAKIQVVELVCVHIVLIGIKMATSSWNIASKEIHIVLVDA